jgi:formamidopyrimidine-DNA glycosylase
VIRNTVDAPFESECAGLCIDDVEVHGPFLRWKCSRETDLVFNLMLAGALQVQQPAERAIGFLCVTFRFDDGTRVNLSDQQEMAKLYLVRHGDYSAISRYTSQGIDVLSAEFTRQRFLDLLDSHGRRQVRVVLNDHTLLSAIGNAYADEILFEARVHPKTFVARLTEEERHALYTAIRSVLDRGIRMVREAGQPIHVKVRNHLLVRNRKGQACPRCGTTIRREGVRGYDVFFCPSCQPPTRRHFIEWA